MTNPIKKCNYLFASRLLYLAVLVLYLANVLYLFLQAGFIESQIHKNIILTNESKSFEYWKHPPVKVYRKFYFFDIQNPAEVQEGKEKPRLAERGPYTYSVIMEKRNVEFLGADLIRYSPTTTLFFEPSMSVGNESDLITVVNVPALGLSEKKLKGHISSELINMVTSLASSHLFISRSVGQLMSGYDDDLLEMAKAYEPKRVKTAVFSFLSGRNNTIYQNLTIMTGHSSYQNLGKIFEWNGQKNMNLWNNTNADSINGTDSIYPPFITRDKVLYSFSSDICRSFNFVYSKDNTLNGIKTFDFKLPSNLFHNSTLNPGNEGLFTHDNYLGNGVHNMSKCTEGFSTFISQPHFLNAEHKFVSALDGINPSEQKHSSVLHFEPTTGVPIKGNVRFMISFYVPHDKENDLINKVQPTLLPAFWFDECVELNSQIQNQLWIVLLLIRISFKLPYILLGSALVLIMFSIFLFIRSFLNEKKHNRLIYL